MQTYKPPCKGGITVCSTLYWYTVQVWALVCVSVEWETPGTVKVPDTSSDHAAAGTDATPPAFSF